MKRRDLLQMSAGLMGATMLPGLASAQVNAADLTRISNYLNGVSTMQGTFVQVGPDGDLSEGLFYMRRPGRIRFEYQPPNPTLIVADGFWVGVYDTIDNTLDRFPLSETPLDLLLRDRVNLRDERAVQSIERSAGQLRPSGRCAHEHRSGVPLLPARQRGAHAGGSDRTVRQPGRAECRSGRSAHSRRRPARAEADHRRQ